MASHSGAAEAEEAAWEEAEAEAWEEAEAEAWSEAEEVEEDAADPDLTCYLLQLPPELLHRILRFVPHTSLVESCYRVSTVLSIAAAMEARTQTRDRLEEALTTGFSAQAVEVGQAQLRVLATALEVELAGQGSPRYRSKCRQLLFNLSDKKNPELRARLLSGALAPGELLRLSAEQLAPAELQQQRADARKRGKMRAMRPECGIGYTTDLYMCENCGCSKTRVHRAVRAGRTAVDRATTYATCTSCRNRWEV